MKRTRRKLLLLRCCLGLLIIANMTMIFLFSAETGKESGETSGRVVQAIAELLVPGFDEMSEQERVTVLESLHGPVRKLAHMAEFGLLSIWILLLSLTTPGRVLPRYGLSVGATALYAVSDEIHQAFSAGRGPGVGDVLIDTLGAILACGAVLGIRAWFLWRKQRKEACTLQLTHYHLNFPSLPAASLKIAVASDLHGKSGEETLRLLEAERPELLLIPGDLMEDKELADEHAPGFAFLRACASLAPTYYSLGNHEIACYHKGNPFRHPTPIMPDEAARARIRATGAILLDNAYVTVGNLTICGLTSGINGRENKPDPGVLSSFASAPGFRILLCHHPEYYIPYVKETGVELTVSGHAHGGHWRVFGRGIYAPGQGLLPKYTSGMPEPGWVISRGIGDHTRIPRFCNRRELLMLHCERKD